MAEIKRPTIVEAEITDDGQIIVEFNKAFRTDTRRCTFTADALIALAEEHSRFADSSETDFPEIPIVDVEDLFEVEDDDDDDDDGDAGEEEDGDGKGEKREA
jgi:hypothetical protein